MNQQNQTKQDMYLKAGMQIKTLMKMNIQEMKIFMKMERLNIISMQNGQKQ